MENQTLLYNMCIYYHMITCLYIYIYIHIIYIYIYIVYRIIHHATCMCIIVYIYIYDCTYPYPHDEQNITIPSGPTVSRTKWLVCDQETGAKARRIFPQTGSLCPPKKEGGVESLEILHNMLMLIIGNTPQYCCLNYSNDSLLILKILQ